MNKKLLICLLMWVMCLPAFAQETFTLFDGTTEGTGLTPQLSQNNKLPAYTMEWNKPTKSQFIIPASFLTEMKGGIITSLKFYAISYHTPYTSASEADVFLSEPDYFSFDADHLFFIPKESGTIVYHGTVTVERVGPTNNEWGEMTITFTTPYQYRGGNLLIAFENTTYVSGTDLRFNGQETMWYPGAAGYLGYINPTNFPLWQQGFIPKTTFTYTPGTLPEYNEFYLVGTFNEWNQTEEGGRLAFAATDEEGVYETEGTLEAGAEFKVITPDGDDWIWFGGVDDNNVGYFLINNDLLNQPLAMVDGANFRLEQGGKFTFSVNANDMTLTVIPTGTPSVVGDVNGDGLVTAVDVTILYNYLIDGTTENMVNGDQSGDGSITSVDVTIVYNVMLGQEN